MFKSLIQKSIILGVLLFLVNFANVYAEADTIKLTTIYHVSINDEHIGTVSNKAIVENVVQEKLQQKQQEYNKFGLIPSGNITYVPEKTFRPVTNDERTVNWIDKNIGVETKATKITFENKSLYVKTKQEADKVLEKLKMKYAPSKNENDASDVDISLSTNPSLTKTEVEPGKVLSVKDAVNFITKGTLEEKIYVVQKGDVLGGIAAEYNLTMSKVLELNSNIKEETLLQIGQKLKVTDYKPIVDVIVEQKVSSREEIPYETETIKSDGMYKGDSKVKQNGVNGEKMVEYLIIQKNGNTESEEVMNEKVTKEPVKKIIVQGTKVVPSRGTSDFSWPTIGGIVTSPMGPRWGTLHKGTDIAGVSNRSILAADNGTVSFAGWDGGYGNKIVINHNNGFKTIYAHLQSIDVSVGETVAKESKIGVMGTTGNSTGVHLHIELYQNGQLKDLQDYTN